MENVLFESFRVYITEKCNAHCVSCFNKTTRSEAMMDLFHFEKICELFSMNGVKRIKIMGGEPTFHPDFVEFAKKAQNYFSSISVFTNAINNGIIEFDPRENDSIIYNFSFHKLWNTEKFLLDKPGRRAFEIQIKPTTDVDEIISYLSDLDIAGIIYVLTLDCTSNIFKYRNVLIDKILKLQNFFQNKKYQMSMDHRLPLCFLYKSGLIVPVEDFSVCSLRCSSLIDANYNLRFCNQSSNILINIFDNDKIIPIQIMKNMLTQEYYKRQISNLNKICNTCVFYGSQCNGGCFINNSLIDKESIIEATDFPKL